MPGVHEKASLCFREGRVGIEPTDGGFAIHCLTAWLSAPRLRTDFYKSGAGLVNKIFTHRAEIHGSATFYEILEAALHPKNFREQA